MTLLPDENLMVVLMEAPNLEYLDHSSPAVNSVVLLDKQTIENYDVYNL